MAFIDYTKKPKRPLGVSLAIIVSVLLFTIIPLLEVAFIIAVDNMMVFDTVGRSGLNVIGFDALKQKMILQVVLAIGFLILSALAWIRRPAKIRQVFSGTIGIIGTLTIVTQILPALSKASTVMDSSREINQSVLIFYLILTVLITLYSVWYLNRWAARAYYRGYYLPADIEEMKRIEHEIMKDASKSKSEA